MRISVLLLFFLQLGEVHGIRLLFEITALLYKTRKQVYDITSKLNTFKDLRYGVRDIYLENAAEVVY